MDFLDGTGLYRSGQLLLGPWRSHMISSPLMSISLSFACQHRHGSTTFFLAFFWFFVSCSTVCSTYGGCFLPMCTVLSCQRLLYIFSIYYYYYYYYKSFSLSSRGRLYHYYIFEFCFLNHIIIISMFLFMEKKNLIRQSHVITVTRLPTSASLHV